jgi:hypothetical protein
VKHTHTRTRTNFRAGREESEEERVCEVVTYASHGLEEDVEEGVDGDDEEGAVDSERAVGQVAKAQVEAGHERADRARHPHQSRPQDDGHAHNMDPLISEWRERMNFQD